MKDRLKALLIAQLRQGASPHGLALSVAVGALCGIFPIFGACTLLAILLGQAFRLNHPVVQAVNYLMAPIQLPLIPLYLLLGERLCGAPPLTLNPVKLVEEFWSDIPLFFAHYGMAGVHGILAWSLSALPIGLCIYFPVRGALSRIPAAVFERKDSP